MAAPEHWIRVTALDPGTDGSRWVWQLVAPNGTPVAESQRWPRRDRAVRSATNVAAALNLPLEA